MSLPPHHLCHLSITTRNLNYKVIDVENTPHLVIASCIVIEGFTRPSPKYCILCGVNKVCQKVENVQYL